jgi:hypothetical protein
MLKDVEVFGMHSEVFMQGKRHKRHTCELIASLFSKYCIRVFFVVITISVPSCKVDDPSSFFGLIPAEQCSHF